MQHSSLFHGNNVDFAGTLLKDVMTDRWILSNTTGHYQTRASKISSCLRALITNGIPIDALDLEYWILMNRDNSHKRNLREKITRKGCKTSLSKTHRKRFLSSRNSRLKGVNEFNLGLFVYEIVS